MKFLKTIFKFLRGNPGEARDDIGGGNPLLLSVIAAASSAPRLEPLSTEDLMVIQRFLLSEPGKAFLERMRAIGAHLAVGACKDVMHTNHSAGCAKGFDDARTWILSISHLPLSDINGARAEKAQSSEGNSDDVQPDATGEALLVERFSP